MKRVLLAGLLSLASLVWSPAFAASTVTINNAANTSSACVVSGNLCVTLQAGGISPTSVSTTDKAGAISSGGVAQAAIALNTSRKGWCIQNDPAATETLYVRANGTASATTGAPVTPGGSVCSSPTLVDTSAISVFAATTGHRWFGQEVQ